MFGVDEYDIEGKLVGNTFNMTIIENKEIVLQAMNATVDALYAEISPQYLFTEIKMHTLSTNIIIKDINNQIRG